MITEMASKFAGSKADKAMMGVETEYRGLSTDVKPAANNGDVFFEMNTKKVFVYNEAGATWVEV